jgi:hypothetical protein
MVCNQTYDHHGHHFLLGPLSSQFCYGLPSSSHWPQGVKTTTGNSKDHVLKLLKNIYGQKQAGGVWNSFLVDELTSLGYTSSLINDCVFFCDDIIFMVYMEDGIFLGNDNTQIQQAIKEIQDLGLNIEDQGHPADYVGVSIKKLQNGSYKFTQQP